MDKNSSREVEGCSLRILIINPFYNPVGGAEIRLRGLIDQIKPELDEVHFLQAGPVLHKKLDDKTWLHQCNTGLTDRMSEAIMVKHEIDIAQQHNNQRVGVKTLVAAKRLGIPSIWVMHDYWPVCGARFLEGNAYDYAHSRHCNDLKQINYSECEYCIGGYERHIVNWEAKYLESATVAIATSNFLINKMEGFGVLEGKWRKIAPWIRRVDNKKLSKKRDLDTVLFVGNTLDHKGLFTVIESLAHCPYKLRIIANPRETWKIDMRAHYRGVGGRIHVAGGRPWDQLQGEYSGSRCAVVASVWDEIFCAVWAEALACKGNAVCSRVGSIPELAGKRVTYFDATDIKGLAEAMEKVKRKDYSKWVRSAFSVERAGRDFLELYEELI